MKTQSWFLMASLSFAMLAFAQTPAPPVESAPPPGAPAKRSAAELEKLVAPIALYPDPLIATLLPASVYPLEIVQAARFVADTNNLDKLDAQPWDDSVKAVARVPDAIKKLNDDLPWTIALGEAFLAQDKDVMDMIQTLRGKAQKAGTLQTTQQQVVVVTNMVVQTKVEQQVVVVTNTVVQIQSSSPEVVYVPTYNPSTVYYPPPAYVYDPIAPLVTFTAGVAMGAIIANNCDWHHGGCYHGDVDIDINRNVNNNFNRNNNINTGVRTTGTSKKWQPDSGRLSKSGSPSASASARSMQSRGWGSGGAARPSTGTVGARPSTGAAGARPSTGNPAARPSTGTPGARPSTGSPSANRPAASPSAGRPGPSPAASPTGSASTPNRSSSAGSAFGGVSGGSGASQYGSRGASSRGSTGGGGRAGGGGRGGRR